jgi:hypothetical protein
MISVFQNQIMIKSMEWVDANAGGRLTISIEVLLKKQDFPSDKISKNMKALTNGQNLKD